MPDLTPRMLEVLTTVAKKSQFSRNPSKSGERGTKFSYPYDGHDRRTAAALAKRGMLEKKDFSARVNPGHLRSLYKWLPYYRVTDAGWEVVVAHRGWRSFRRSDIGHYVLLAPDGSTLLGTAFKAPKGGWTLFSADATPLLPEAPRLSNALERLLQAHTQVIL